MSKNITVSLKAGAALEVPEGTPIGSAVDELCKKSNAKIVAVEIESRLVDLSFPLEEDLTFSPVSIDSSEGMEILRHSAAHVMADAVQRLFPMPL